MRVIRALGLVVVAWSFAASCGSDEIPPIEPTVTTEPSDSEVVICTDMLNLVPADQVVVSGDLTEEQMEEVSWGLQRYSLAGLELSAELIVTFDPDKELCNGSTGLCIPGADPPGVFICGREGDNAYRVLGRRMTLLHELAHLWHVGEKQQGRLVDPSPIVGGQDPTTPAAWSERSEERLAVVLTWGLMDQLRRPVPSLLAEAAPYEARVTCTEMYIQFQALTGTLPLEPIEEGCRPPE